MEISNFVSVQRKIDNLRKETKDYKKELRTAVESAKEDLLESMDAAGVTSIASGESEWMVIVEKKKAVKYTPELVTEILVNMTDDDLRMVMHGTDMTLTEATRKFVCAKVASASEDDDEPKRSFRVQNHCPRNFVRVAEDSTEIIADALSVYKNADLERKAYAGLVKDRLDEIKQPQTDATDIAVFEYVSQTNVGEAEIAGGHFTEDGGVRFRTAPIHLRDGEDAPDGPLYLKAEKKYKPRKIPKKKFMELVDQSVHAIMTRRFGDAPSVTEERVKEAVLTADEVVECLTDKITLESAPEETTKVTLTNKRPRV